MLFGISHKTDYKYSSGVFLEPHTLRFKPKLTPHSVLKNFSIKIEPEPSGLSEQIDIENNFNLFCWFEGTHSQIRISSIATVEVEEFNPFNFLIHPPEFLHLSFEYDQRTKQLLKPSLYVEGLPESMVEYTEEILSNSSSETVDFLIRLTRGIHLEFNLTTREVGEPHSPDITFKNKSGSCRDLAWMQIHMLRKLGIACRFVSGYLYVDAENPEFELHAWVEVYLPGAGWIGLDPSHGMLTSGYHIPVTSSAYYQNTMPVCGSIRGKASSSLKNYLKITLDP